MPTSNVMRIPREEFERFLDQHGFHRPPDRHGKTRILVVDDERPMLDLLERTFGDPRRFDVRSASTGFDAGLLAGTFVPDVILMDIELGDIDGRAVVKSIRLHAVGRHPVIIAISGKLTEEDAAGLTVQGFDAYLAKPFPPSTALALVDKLTAVP